MQRARTYPDEPAGPFPRPPSTEDDREGRPIEIRALDSSEGYEVDALVGMYDQFDPADRAQGIPPTGADRIREWLETILADSVDVVACHDGTVVAHATLVPDVDDPDDAGAAADVEWELAIFVLQDYQRAGIGTRLLEHLLGRASERGIEHVWLTVERWNRPAISLYETVGFEACGTESFEQEMAIRLGGEDERNGD